MTHYGIVQWVDFTRGLVAAEDAAAMRNHADSCDECRRLAEYCSKLAAVCARMTRLEVPADLVRRARSLFPVQFPEPPKSNFRVPVELIYDSFLVPAPAGLRANWQVGWQGLYHAGACSLDLRIEPELRSSRASVIGQISDHLAPENRMSDIPVCVKSGRLVVAETRSNQFGEFQLEYEQQNRLQLHVALDGGSRSISVPLKRCSADQPVGTGRLPLGSATRRKGAAVRRQAQD
jgi:hypothetical protein